jgi:hypothetical protein
MDNGDLEKRFIANNWIPLNSWFKTLIFSQFNSKQVGNAIGFYCRSGYKPSLLWILVEIQIWNLQHGFIWHDKNKLLMRATHVMIFMPFKWCVRFFSVIKIMLLCIVGSGESCFIWRCDACLQRRFGWATVNFFSFFSLFSLIS